MRNISKYKKTLYTLKDKELTTALRIISGSLYEEGYAIVGGVAVNVWLSYLLPKNEAESLMRPTSDIDMLLDMTIADALSLFNGIIHHYNLRTIRHSPGNLRIELYGNPISINYQTPDDELNLPSFYRGSLQSIIENSQELPIKDHKGRNLFVRVGSLEDIIAYKVMRGKIPQDHADIDSLLKAVSKTKIRITLDVEGIRGILKAHNKENLFPNFINLYRTYLQYTSQQQE